MRLSIRNQFPATVVSVSQGEVMATVRSRLAGGQIVTAAITLDSADDLELAEGQPVTVLIKATEMAVATGEVGNLSIRNRIPGTIRSVSHGVVMTTLTLDIGRGDTLTAAITKDAADELGLAEGDAVTALVKSTEVSLAIGG